MIYLVLAVCCSLSIGMIFKHAGRRQMDRLGLLTANYATACLMALVFAQAFSNRGALAADGLLVAIGILTGALFIAGFFALSLATEVAGMSMATGIWRVSVVIPFLASWLVWNEVPTVLQGAGLVVASASFFLIAHTDRGTAGSRGKRWSAGATAAVLALLFVTGGTVDVLLKAFDEGYEAARMRPVFMTFAFGVACIIGTLFVGRTAWRHGRFPSARTLSWGVLLGVVNYGSVAFILRAIRELPGPFVFPANNIALMVGAALLGVFAWGETPTRRNWAGLALAVLAFILLSV